MVKGLRKNDCALRALVGRRDLEKTWLARRRDYVREWKGKECDEDEAAGVENILQTS